MSRFVRHLPCIEIWPGSNLGLSARKMSRKVARPPIARSIPRTESSESSATKWLLLAIPATTFGLGLWQVKRRKWKNDLIEKIDARIYREPQDLPEPSEVANWKDLEYSRFSVWGEFIHTKELYVEPRTYGKPREPEGGALISSKPRVGLHVITPLYIPDRGYSILINRGFVDKDHKDPSTRQEGQVKGIVEVVGLLRITQKTQAGPVNDVQRNQWCLVDVEQMAQVTGCRPVMLDAVAECSVKGGPVGGQTRVKLWNHHVDYIITWFSLSAITSFMWYSKFIRKVRIP